MGLLDGLFDSGNGASGISPTQLGLLNAAAAFAPSLQYSRLPQNPTAGLLSAMGGFGQGLLQGQQSQLLGQEAEQRRLANAVTMARYRDISQRHPDWFSGIPGMGGGANPLQVAQTAAAPQNVSSPAQDGQQIAAAPSVNSAPGGMPMEQPARGNPTPPQGVGGGIPTPTNLTDASDLLFLHPELKEVVAKQFAGPTDAERALAGAHIDPNSPQGRAMLSSAALTSVGFKPFIGGERGGVPVQYLNQNMRYEADTSQLPAWEAAAAASSRGTAMGALGAKEAEASFKAGLDVKVADETAKRKTFYETGVMPPGYGGPQTQPAVSPSGDIATSRGTIVPPPPKANPFMGTDAIIKQNTNTQETEKNFGAVRPALDQSESRLAATAQALKVVESQGFNEHRAEIAAKLDGLGFKNVANLVMGGKEVAAVQSALALQTIDVLGQLKQINQGTGGRILNSEFTNLLDKQYGPDLKPEANYNLITQALGGIYQTRNMIDDYYQVGKPGGWGRDANAYVSAWQSNKANGMTEMVSRAEKAIGPLKGMTGNAGPAAPAVVAPPSAAVKHLQMNPSLSSDFDKKYGAGAAAKVLGK